MLDTFLKSKQSAHFGSVTATFTLEEQYAVQAQSAAGYPQPVPGAAAQFAVPDFSGVPESYVWGPGGMPTGNTPF